MESIALYRKYRPQSFKDVLGQDHIVGALEGALKQGNVSHAYLFSGTRGTGKTSVARIVASTVGTTSKDLYEIDAASNRGIDDIRALREGVHTLPFESKYKVYIIDEAHMLTKEAFNALLKTLEEPPKHALFILATTEEGKLPETIISRCQHFSFRKPSQKTLKDVIVKIAKAEGFTLELASADLIAMLGDGSFRDAQGILQKVISASRGKKINFEEVEQIVGAPKSTLVNEVVEALTEKNVERGLEAIGKAASQNIDMKVFVTLLLHKVRGVMLLRFAPHMKETLAGQFSENDFTFLQNVAENKDTNINASVLYELLGAYEETGRSCISQLPLELALVKITKAKN